ncbi:NmrA family NAD(P)-binding protein [Chryseobacterium shandongense]|uniref:NmrA family NAD(P)-binding protein n=1 Tax=Chryseobacterium shandongense TaxID=1493872 RepID=UPI000F4F82F7|nr:NAD(P)H-binding protein [Chryseobacterium shandongense]AZA56941.1 NAD-dependent epimerase/dehydratase family protein [Chryseobacterium shandongense]
MKNILVTGATGIYGSNAISHLLRKGILPDQISALVRNPEKASYLSKLGVTVVEGDYNNYASLVRGFKNIDKLLFVSSNDVGQREVQHENVIKAA